MAEQDFGDFEYIIKDGGSRDGSVDAVRSFLPPNAQIVVRPDGGIYSAMNQALAVCRGKLVLFLNAGDTLAVPHALRVLASAVGRDPEADILYWDMRRSDVSVTVSYPARLTRWRLARNPLCHQSYAVKRELLCRVGGFDERFRIAADHDAFLRMSLVEHARAEHVAGVLTVYEGGGFSASAGARAQLHKEAAEVRRKYFRRSELAGLTLFEYLTLQRVRVRIANSRWMNLGRRYARLKKWAERRFATGRAR